jgi:hypothetical protein
MRDVLDESFLAFGITWGCILPWGSSAAGAWSARGDDKASSDGLAQLDRVK